MKSWFLTASLAMLMALSSTANAKERIISIGGDVTEIVYALGASDQLVARDSTSLRPEQVKALPNVGYMRMLNTEGILALKPTLVLASELSEPSLVLKQLSDSGVTVVRVPGEASLDAVTNKIKVIATALHKEDAGKALVATYEKQLAAVNKTPLPVKVLYIMSHGGTVAMAAGQETAADAVIKSAGLQNAMQGFKHYRPLSQEGVIASAPDLVLIGADGVKAMGGEDRLWSLPGLALTPAAKQKNVLLVDDMALLGFGLSTPDALQKLRNAAEKLNAK